MIHQEISGRELDYMINKLRRVLEDRITEDNSEESINHAREVIAKYMAPIARLVATFQQPRK